MKLQGPRIEVLVCSFNAACNIHHELLKVRQVDPKLTVLWQWASFCLQKYHALILLDMYKIQTKVINKNYRMNRDRLVTNGESHSGAQGMG